MLEKGGKLSYIDDNGVQCWEEVANAFWFGSALHIYVKRQGVILDAFMYNRAQDKWYYSVRDASNNVTGWMLFSGTIKRLDFRITYDV